MEAARQVLFAGRPDAKTAAAATAYENWRVAGSESDCAALAALLELPDRPSRPETPRLAPPSEMPKRRLSSVQGRIALLHAVAHIEFNAIDLAFDMAARFTPEISEAGLDAHQFVSDWFSVGADEARHFNLVSNRLAELDASYGDLPAHDGLWEAALSTADSALARLAIAPMVLEARGLDVTPGMISKLRAVGDTASADVLKIIYEEEIGHVAKGRFWFESLCRVRNLDPKASFRSLVKDRFAGDLKPPFNHKARSAAGIPEAFYL